MMIGREWGGDESDVWSFISKAKVKDSRTQDQLFNSLIYTFKKCSITSAFDEQRKVLYWKTWTTTILSGKVIQKTASECAAGLGKLQPTYFAHLFYVCRRGDM